MEKVSIVIPVYNAEKYLVECIESALNQTYKEIEVIAVNDGSTDNSLNILKKYSDKIKIISKENGGIATALNAGIKVTKGEWVKWLSADDVLYPDAVEVLLSEAKNFPDKTDTIFYGNWDIMESNGKIIGRYLEPNYNDLTKFDFNVILLDHHIGNEDTTLIHKSIFDKYGYFNDPPAQEDYDLRLKHCLLHHCRCRLVQKTVLKYRIHVNQTSRAVAKKRDYSINTREKILDQLEPAEREKYRIALNKYNKNRPFMEKTQQFLQRWVQVNLPPSISTKIMIFYIRLTLGQNYVNKI